MNNTSIGIILLILMVTNVNCISWYLEPNTHKCLKEDVQANVLVTGEYDVSEAMGQKVDYVVLILCFFLEKFFEVFIDYISLTYNMLQLFSLFQQCYFFFYYKVTIMHYFFMLKNYLSINFNILDQRYQRTYTFSERRYSTCKIIKVFIYHRNSGYLRSLFHFTCAKS